MINRPIVLKRVKSTTFEPVPNRIVKRQCAIRATSSAATTLGTPRRMENAKCTPFTNSSISIRMHRVFLMDISSWIAFAPGNNIARISLRSFMFSQQQEHYLFTYKISLISFTVTHFDYVCLTSSFEWSQRIFPDHVVYRKKLVLES